MPKADDSRLLELAQPVIIEQSYTILEIAKLVAAYVGEVAEPNSMVDWRMSDFLLWLRRQSNPTRVAGINVHPNRGSVALPGLN